MSIENLFIISIGILILILLTSLIILNFKIMSDVQAVLDQLTTQTEKIAALEAAKEKEHEQIKQAIEELKAANETLQETNRQLQTVIDSGGIATSEQLQTIKDAITANNLRIDTVKTSLEAIIPDQAPEPGEGENV